MDYTVIGDMVNLASRLEGLTKTYHQSLIFSDTLYPTVKGSLECRELDSVAVKGKTKGVKIYTAKKALTQKEARAWSIHAQAMEDYYNRRFAHAAGLFREVQRILPGDDASLILGERCALYAKSPPPKDWDGVEVMKTK
jgi:adenylate cyclase